MKKAYTITPKEYFKKLDELDEIEYRHGEDAKYASERIQKKYKRLTEQTKAFKEPKDAMFLRNADLYNLWLNKDTDEPITAKELFNIINGITGEMRDDISSATYEYDGSTIM